MIKLSDRLQLMFDIISDEREKLNHEGIYTMVDVGTDHGYLPISLWERDICSQVILADVSRGSLDKAETNCRMWHPEEKFDLRLGDGIKVIKKGEADAVTIAGMGGTLISQILEEDMDKSRSIPLYVLQPRSAKGELRSFLLRNGFFIGEDYLVREGKYICSVLKVFSKEEQAEGRAFDYIQKHREYLEGLPPESAELQVPMWLPLSNGSNGMLAAEYIEEHIQKQKFIIDTIQKSGAVHNERIQQAEADLKYLRQASDYCKQTIMEEK